MSTQSGISVSSELENAFSTACTEPGSVRAIQIKIINESLEPAQTIQPSSDDLSADFDHFTTLLSDSEPCYFAVNTDNTSWLLISYVPSSAPVRAKMLHSSSKATLLRQLGRQYFTDELFATTPDEISTEGYKKHLAHKQADNPMTAREQEMKDLKEAEGKEVLDDSRRTPRSHIEAAIDTSASMKQRWSEDAEIALQELAAGNGPEVLVLGIDLAEQIVVHEEKQEVTDLGLPLSAAAFAFVRLPHCFVFIYSCPSTSPIKSRMVFSSASNFVKLYAKHVGINDLRKMETSDPAEITIESLQQEFGEQQEQEKAATPVPEASTGFARPSRPGRKR